jgi:hypothetical protein
MNDYEIGQLLRELVTRTTAIETSTVSLRNELLGYVARLTLVESRTTANEIAIAQLKAEDHKHNALHDSGRHDISRMQPLIEKHEQDIERLKAEHVAELDTKLAETKRDDFRSIAPKAGTAGGLLMAVILIIVRWITTGSPF